jgi:hypothetical protein
MKQCELDSCQVFIYNQTGWMLKTFNLWDVLATPSPCEFWGGKSKTRATFRGSMILDFALVLSTNIMWKPLAI